MEMPICPDRSTGESRALRYDENGYELVVGGRTTFHRRLAPVCYLVGRRERERIALLHGLQDAGEFGLAKLIEYQRSIHP